MLIFFLTQKWCTTEKTWFHVTPLPPSTGHLSWLWAVSRLLENPWEKRKQERNTSEHWVISVWAWPELSTCMSRYTAHLFYVQVPHGERMLAVYHLSTTAPFSARKVADVKRLDCLTAYIMYMIIPCGSCVTWNTSENCEWVHLAHSLRCRRPCR